MSYFAQDFLNLRKSTQSCNQNIEGLKERLGTSYSSLSDWKENAFNSGTMGFYICGGEVTSFLTNGAQSLSAFVLLRSQKNQICDYIVIVAGKWIFTGRYSIEEDSLTSLSYFSFTTQI